MEAVGVRKNPRCSLGNAVVPLVFRTSTVDFSSVVFVRQNLSEKAVLNTQHRVLRNSTGGFVTRQAIQETAEPVVRVD